MVMLPWCSAGTLTSWKMKLCEITARETMSLWSEPLQQWETMVSQQAALDLSPCNLLQVCTADASKSSCITGTYLAGLAVSG